MIEVEGKPTIMEMPWHYQGYTDFVVAIAGMVIFCAIIIAWAMIEDAMKHRGQRKRKRR